MKPISAILVLLASARIAIAGCPVIFEMPSDDRWHYPFNFTPGARSTASCFGSTADPEFETFNDRDGIFLIAWRTDAVIASGLPAQMYEILAVRVTLKAAALPLVPADWFVDLTVDPWFNMDFPLTDSDPGSPLELFGVGFGPRYTRATWNESQVYEGGDDQGYSERDPFPFVFSGSGLVHVEDSVKLQFTPQPWAIGVPQNYIRPQTFPFLVHFDVDLTLSDDRVLEYFQEALQNGKVFIAVTSLYSTFKQAPTGFPSFFTKESPDPAGSPPKLIITIASTGDVNADGFRGASDHAALAGCIGGPGVSPPGGGPVSTAQCLCSFDFDDDNDVDVFDVAEFQERFNGGA